MSKILSLFRERLSEELIVNEIQERNDKRNQILKITFGRGQGNFVIIRQENDNKPNYSFFKNENNEESLKTTSSCDFIIIMNSKNIIEIAFVECKSNTDDYEKAAHQINFSILWFNYLFECYCHCFKINDEEKTKWETAIKSARKYLIYPATNATKTKSFTHNSVDCITKKCQKLGVTPLPQQLLSNKKIHINNPKNAFFA